MQRTIPPSRAICLDDRCPSRCATAGGLVSSAPLLKVGSVAQDETNKTLLFHSDELLESERRSLVDRTETLRRRVEMHRALLQQLEVELATEERLLREIEELTDRRPQLRLERLDRELRGQRLREVAVEVLRLQGQRSPIHYRDWFSLVRAAGWEVGGRNPLNTFLTEVGRADGVERIGQRSGLYRLTAA